MDKSYRRRRRRRRQEKVEKWEARGSRVLAVDGADVIVTVRGYMYVCVYR